MLPTQQMELAQRIFETVGRTVVVEEAHGRGDRALRLWTGLHVHHSSKRWPRQA